MTTSNSAWGQRAGATRTRSWILVVDDSREVRDAIVEYLGTHGLEVKAADATEALILLGEAPVPPAVVLLDWVMPDVSGLEVLQRLRADFRTRRCVVVVLTGLGPMMVKESQLAALGVTRVLRKPVSGKELLAIVEEARRAASSPFTRPA